jgi:hypothetical protein
MSDAFGNNEQWQSGMTPFAVTPDALGENWRNFRLALHLNAPWNGAKLAKTYGEPMTYDDNVRIEATLPDGPAPYRVLQQMVVRHERQACHPAENA